MGQDKRGEKEEWKENPAATTSAVTLDVAAASSDDYSDDDEASLAPPTAGVVCSARKRLTAVVTVVALVLVCVLVAVAIAVSQSSSRSALSVPHTFSASFQSQVTAGTNGDVVTGADARQLSGTMHKTQGTDGVWRVSGVATVTGHASQVTRVTLVDNRAYVEIFDAATYDPSSDTNVPTGQACGDDTMFAALHDVGSAVGSASPLAGTAGVAGAKRWCADADVKFAVRTQGRDYVVCQLPDNAFQVAGHGFVTHVSDVDTGAPTATPYSVPTNMTSNGAMECPELDLVASSRLRRRAVVVVQQVVVADPMYLYSYPPSSAVAYRRRRLDAAPTAPRRRAEIDDDTDGSAEGKAPFKCLMVHGAGCPSSAATKSTPQPEGYWSSSIHDALAPYCDSFAYLHMDTVSQAWDETALADAFCTEAANVGSVVTNTLIVAHGTGNAIVANALRSGRCSLHTGSTFWLEMQSQTHSGVSAAFAQQFCSEYGAAYPNAGAARNELQTDMRMCASTGASTAAPGWTSQAFSYGGFNSALESTVATHVFASACATNPAGLMGTSYAGVLDTPLDAATPASPPAWSRCWQSAFDADRATSPSSRMYHTAVNFLDLTGRNGCGWSGEDRVPMEWVSNMAREAQAQVGDRSAVPWAISSGENFPLGSETASSGAIQYRIFSRWDTCYLQDLHDHCVTGDPNIVYKMDETNTNVDHDCIMSGPAGDALDQLQALVRAEWGPSMNVYVTDAWDGDGGHSSLSKHWEGRAIDMVTSDFDNSKLGRLASLAVTAGFNWAYNEVSHVHASVRPAPGACVLSHSNVD